MSDDIPMERAQLTSRHRALHVIHQLPILLQILSVIKPVLPPSRARSRIRTPLDAEFPLQRLQLGTLSLRRRFLTRRLLLQIFSDPKTAKVHGPLKMRNLEWTKNALFRLLDGAEAAAAKVPARVIIARLLTAHAPTSSTQLRSKPALPTAHARHQTEGNQGVVINTTTTIIP